MPAPDGLGAGVRNAPPGTLERLHRGNNDLTLERTFVSGQVLHFFTHESWPVGDGRNSGTIKGKCAELGCSPFFGPLEMGGLGENLNTTIFMTVTASINLPLITGSAELFRRCISQ